MARFFGSGRRNTAFSWNLLPMRSTGRCSASVVDEAGIKSQALDGCRFQAQSGRMSPPISDGRMECPLAIISAHFLLVCPAGRRQALERV